MPVMYKGHKVVLEYQKPPIPTNKHDWVAYVDGCEEDGNYCYGPTADDALTELCDLLDEMYVDVPSDPL